MLYSCAIYHLIFGNGHIAPLCSDLTGVSHLPLQNAWQCTKGVMWLFHTKWQRDNLRMGPNQKRLKWNFPKTNCTHCMLLSRLQVSGIAVLVQLLTIVISFQNPPNLPNSRNIPYPTTRNNNYKKPKNSKYSQKS